MAVKLSELRDTFLDREAIKDCLYRYSRGVDRLDEEMLLSAYWPDAIDHHLDFTGTAKEFVDWAFPQMRHMDQTMHIIANALITIRGAAADVESYFYGIHRVDMGTHKADFVGAGRYLDRFERRDDEWRIAERTVVTDWFREYFDSADWSKGLMGIPVEPGQRWPEDISYSLLNIT